MDEENFLSVLSGHTQLAGVLTPADIMTIQSKLWVLLGKRTQSYTLGDSSSVRVETAQALLKSASFIIGLNFECVGNPETIHKQLVSDDFDVLFKAGLEEAKVRVKTGEELLQKAIDTALEIENFSYKNTINEIKTFFKLYDIYNFAHDIPCMIDYPLAQSVDEALLGIDYINEYLRQLIMENEFCSHFETETVIALIRSINPDYKNNHLNIYEMVAVNAFALTLCKGDMTSLDITQNDREKLFLQLNSWQEQSVVSEIQAASSALCSALDITDRNAINYLIDTISAILPRLQQSMKTKRLDVVFPALYREPEDKKPSVVYVDGALMDAKKLQTLIGEISSCRYVADKIALVKQNVHSLRDYFDILNICFWDEECLVLFDSLSHEELRHLRLALKQKQKKFPEWTSETGWENYLMDYTRGL